MPPAPLPSSALVRGSATIVAIAAALALVVACSKADAPATAASAPASGATPTALAAVRDEIRTKNLFRSWRRGVLAINP